MNWIRLLKEPTAFLPLVMSLGALATVLSYVALHGPAPQPDEGGAAHLWQLLMGGQVPVIAWFAMRWLGREPRAAGPVLLLQVAAAIAAAAPVFLLGF